MSKTNSDFSELVKLHTNNNDQKSDKCQSTSTQPSLNTIPCSQSIKYTQSQEPDSSIFIDKISYLTRISELRALKNQYSNYRNQYKIQQEIDKLRLQFNRQFVNQPRHQKTIQFGQRQTKIYSPVMYHSNQQSQHQKFNRKFSQNQYMLEKQICQFSEFDEFQDNKTHIQKIYKSYTKKIPKSFKLLSVQESSLLTLRKNKKIQCQKQQQQNQQ